MTNHIQRKIDKLPNADRIPKRWRHMKAAKESRHPDTKWKVNPIKQVPQPAAITVFKQLPDALRHKMFRKLGVMAEFNPKKLVTYQPVISASAVLDFASNEKAVLKKKAYVVGTELGPCLWNGNHRAVARLLTGKKFKAVFLDLV